MRCLKINVKIILKRIYEIAQRGDAREESYYSNLEGLLKGIRKNPLVEEDTQTQLLPKKRRLKQALQILESGTGKAT